MQEQQQKRNIPCYCMKLRRASAVITKFYNDRLRVCDITARQFSLLHKINEQKHCSVKELSDMAELDRSTLARSLKPLYQQNLVVDVKPRDARNSRLELTPSGEDTLVRATTLWTKAQTDVLEKLGEDGIERLDQILGLLETL